MIVGSCCLPFSGKTWFGTSRFGDSVPKEAFMFLVRVQTQRTRSQATHLKGCEFREGSKPRHRTESSRFRRKVGFDRWSFVLKAK